jgi:hypothetical protein
MADEDRTAPHCLRPMGALKPDCQWALPRKGQQSWFTEFSGTLSPVRVEGKICRIAAISSNFRRNAGRRLHHLSVVRLRRPVNGGRLGDHRHEGAAVEPLPLSRWLAVLVRDSRNGLSCKTMYHDKAPPERGCKLIFLVGCHAFSR